MMSLFVTKLFDPIGFALVLAVVQFSRMKWIVLPAALCAAVVGETIIVSIQQAGNWGQGLPAGLLAGMVQASAVFGIRSLFDARKQAPDGVNGDHGDPALESSRPDFRHDASPMGISDVSAHLEKMGYRLTIVGAGYAVMQRRSGFGAVEVALQIAMHTLALDVRAAEGDSERGAEILEHAKRIVELLDDYKSAGIVHPVRWERDTKVITGIAYPGRQQDAWLELTLSNPMVGETRLAVNMFDEDRDLAADPG